MKNCVIYGGTTTGKMIYNKVKDIYNVLYFIDGNPSLIGTKKEGLEIRNPSAILDAAPDIIVMAILTGYEEAVKDLHNMGFPEERIITKYVDLNTRARNEALFCVSKILRDKCVDGAVAELGVYRGDFAKEINSVFPERDLYLFDTFEGFPDEDMNYEIRNDLMLNKVGKLTNTSVDFVMNRMLYKEKIKVMKGYFPDTTKGLENINYAFVNIDVDLYKPIMAGLQYFWPRMSDNGYIFVHDYFSDSYAGAKKAIEEFAAENNIGYIPIGDTLSVAFVKIRR